MGGLVAYHGGMGFFGNVVRSLNRLTDSQGVRVAVNLRFARYGKMTELKIDSEKKVIEAVLMLKGETEPIRLRVGNYNLHHDGKVDLMTVGEVTVSREWMEVLAKEMVVGKPVVLPEGVGKWMRMVL